jgi:hypothetical protein
VNALTVGLPVFLTAQKSAYGQTLAGADRKLRGLAGVRGRAVSAGARERLALKPISDGSRPIAYGCLDRIAHLDEGWASTLAAPYFESVGFDAEQRGGLLVIEQVFQTGHMGTHALPRVTQCGFGVNGCAMRKPDAVAVRCRT